jgi:AcrR family transcriptional regulator
MVSDRRVGLETSESRSALIDSVEAVMRQQGYAALSVRRVAESAGLKHQLVYYYFQNMDELLLATYRRYTDRVAAGVTEALRSPEPLRALWRVWSEPANARLNLEFLALTSHNEVIRAHTAAFGEHMRVLLREQVQARMAAGGWLQGCPAGLDPLALTMALGAIGTIIGLKSGVGLAGAYGEVCTVVEWCLNQLERPSTGSSGTRDDGSD